MRTAAPSPRGRDDERNDYPYGTPALAGFCGQPASDLPARFRAHAASIAARAKVLRRMTAAFLRTFIADPRAQCTEFEGEMALSRQRRGRKAAHRTAIGVEPNALGHRRDARVCEARRCTTVASGGARIACVDTGLVGFSVHAASPVPARRARCRPARHIPSCRPLSCRRARRRQARRSCRSLRRRDLRKVCSTK